MAAIDGSITAVASAGINFTGAMSGDFANPSHSFSATHSVSITTIGTGTDAANQYWSDQRSLNASATETLDLSGSLTNGLGQTVALTSVKMLYIRNRSTTGDMVIGNAASNVWATLFGGDTHTLTIRRGGCLLVACADATGYAVAAGTDDNLKIANSDGSNSLTYDIVIVGAQ